MGNLLARVGLLLKSRHRAPRGGLGQTRPLPVSRQPTARPGRGHPGAPPPAHHPQKPRRPPPATFKITPRRPCALPPATSAPVRVPAACGGRGEKLVLSPSRSVTFAYRGPVGIRAAGRHFRVLRMRSLQTLKSSRRTLEATGERSRDHPQPAGHREVGVQTGPWEHGGPLSGKAPLSSGLQASGAGPGSSRGPPLHLQALQAGPQTPSASSPQPSVPPPARQGQPPGGPLPSAALGAVPCCSLPGKSTAEEQPAEPRASPPGPPVGTEVAGQKPPGGPSGSAPPQSAGRRASKRKQPPAQQPPPPAPLQLPLQWGRGEFPPPPKLPCLGTTNWQATNNTQVPSNNIPSKGSTNQLVITEGPAEPRASPPGPPVGPKVSGQKPPGGPSGSAPPQSAGRRASKRKQPPAQQPPPPALLQLPRQWGRGEFPPPPKLPCLGTTNWQATNNTQVPSNNVPSKRSTNQLVMTAGPAEPRARPPGPPVGPEVSGQKPPGGPSGSAPPQSAGRRASKRKQPPPPAPLQLPRQWGRGEFPPPPKLPCLGTTNWQATNNTQVPSNNIPSKRSTKNQLVMKKGPADPGPTQPVPSSTPRSGATTGRLLPPSRTRQPHTATTSGHYQSSGSQSGAQTRHSKFPTAPSDAENELAELFARVSMGK
ncbi:basic proline-rich protein-like [Sorex araneus]|uniref:basic proline-rich protein-like n=1 Tax=Sorex araneus TaxID=42254 RepID=UPI002433896D|nr:basic proline-rich protein-like [Sorex araneus]XP_054995972.1 basic proline-rich protein-like [Sorex araneus]